jgi:hypothetical protein
MTDSKHFVIMGANGNFGPWPPAAGYRTFNRLPPHYRPMLKLAMAAQGYQQWAFYLRIYFNVDHRQRVSASPVV